MGDFTENFDRSEYDCRCGCKTSKPDLRLAVANQETRDHFNSPVIISGPGRCRKYNNKLIQEAKNRKLAGLPYSMPSKNSKHLPNKYGFHEASDIEVESIHPDAVADYLEMKYPDSCGIGRYDKFTHFDIRSKKARWDYRTKKTEES